MIAYDFGCCVRLVSVVVNYVISSKIKIHSVSETGACCFGHMHNQPHIGDPLHYYEFANRIVATLNIWFALGCNDYPGEHLPQEGSLEWRCFADSWLEVEIFKILPANCLYVVNMKKCITPKTKYIILGSNLHKWLLK